MRGRIPHRPTLFAEQFHRIFLQTETGSAFPDHWPDFKERSLGTLFLIVQVGVLDYWANSYWGGALPAAGGALVLGALPRLARRASVSAAVLGALGIVLLANTRPYEGLITTVASAVALVWWRRQEGRPLRLLFVRPVVVPAAVVLCIGGAWMGYYNYQVAGKPWLLPYSVNSMMYAATPSFYLLPVGPVPTYRHDIIRKFWMEWVYDIYLHARANPLGLGKQFVKMTTSFYLSPLLDFAILIAVFLTPTRKVRMALGIAGALALGLCLGIGVLPHYYAPVIGLVLVPGMIGVRYLSLIHRGPRAVGYLIVLLFALSCFAEAVSRFITLHSPLSS